MEKMDYQHMDYQIVRGLNCNTCEIASCRSSKGFYRTPVSRLDARIKKMDMDMLEWDDEVEMYIIKRREDTSCVFFDGDKCSLDTEYRPNACLAYPVRVYRAPNDLTLYLILDMRCPSSLNLFDLFSRREPSVVNYVKDAAYIFMWDSDYRYFVLDRTKEFTRLLRLSPANAVFSIDEAQEYLGVVDEGEEK